MISFINNYHHTLLSDYLIINLFIINMFLFFIF